MSGMCDICKHTAALPNRAEEFCGSCWAEVDRVRFEAAVHDITEEQKEKIAATDEVVAQ